MATRCVLLSVLVLILAPMAAQAVHKGASITLRARWQGTSYLLEAAEFLADESADKYWQYVEGLKTLDSQPKSVSECWRFIVGQGTQLIMPAVAKMLPITLGVRQYSAKLEMFRQTAAQLHPNTTASSCCFVNVDGRVVPGGDLAALEAALGDAERAGQAQGEPEASVQLHAFDHVYNPQQQGAKGATHAILYAPPGTACFEEMHRRLKAAADASAAAGERPVVYAHRPLLGEACRAKEASDCLLVGTEEQLVLPGYGVEAVLKNMEYSAMDDKKDKGVEAQAAAAQGAEQAAVDDSSLVEVKGFRFDVLVKRKPELRQELLTFRDALMAGEDDEAIKVWDLKDAGLQATSRIAQSGDPLALLQELSQSFPSIVSSLTRQAVAPTLRGTVQHNQRFVSPGANILMLNGMMIEVQNFELYAFLDRLRIELRMVGQLQAAGLKAPDAQEVLSERTSDSTGTVSQEIRLDLAPYYKLPWLNNLEKDKRLVGTSRSVQALLNMYPNRPRPLGANLFHLIYIGDPTSMQGLAVGRIFSRIHQKMFPVRMALLPQVPDAVARAVAARHGSRGVDPPEWKDMSLSEQFSRSFLTLRSAFGGLAALDFWERVSAAVIDRGAKNNADTLRTAFVAAWGEAGRVAETRKGKVAAKKAASAAWGDLEQGSGYSSEAGMALSDLSSLALRKGLAQMGRAVLWANGVINALPEGESDWRELDHELSFIMSDAHQYLQEQIYFGRVTDDDDVLPSIMDLVTSVKRWNPAVLGVGDDSGGDDGAGKIPMSSAVSHPSAASITYLYAPNAGSSKSKGSVAWGPDKVYPVTHWVAVDLATPRGRSLAVAALDRLLSVEDDDDVRRARVALLLAPAAAPAGSALDALAARLLRAYSAAGAAAADGRVLRMLRALLTSKDAAALGAAPLSSVGTEAELARQLLPLAREAGLVSDPEDGAPRAAEAALSEAVGGIGAADLSEAAAGAAPLADLASGPCGLERGAAAVITNGRVIVDWSPKRAEAEGAEAGHAGALTAEDFGLMQMFAEDIQPGAAIAKAVRSSAKEYLSPGNMSDAVLVAASAIGAQVYPDSRFGSLHAKHINNVLDSLRGKPIEAAAAKNPGTLLKMVSIANPLTREAQRMSQVLAFVRDVLGDVVSIQLHLNPRLDLSDMPLKNYYRYSLPEFPRDEGGQLGLPGAPSVYFPRLPPKRVLTLNLELPESWLVEATQAVYDLDNLRLADVPESVAYAEYELEALMLTGSCSEQMPKGRKGPPPRGLELELGTRRQPHMVDTLVMSNMGYFQLKSSPGLWQLSVSPGRSRELFGVVVPPQAGRPAGATPELVNGTAVYIDSFSGRHVKLRVRKRPGKEGEQLLPEDGKGASWSFSGKEAAKKPEDDVINVFTVASGHMYERLQKIMILSVIKNTKSRVKFWFIKNYMSPHHMRIIPLMAEKYGFDYAFVTYRWPHWLHKQTDKQRIIWAYKILFLDVLFPLDVRRVIFVDSDQVVRTDLKLLMDMDMKGAAMAYTPFCDNNKEMDEFRFWKGGFWKQHLQGKPYHISALYVIDLHRFRQLAAGDNYRVIYENLSKDPNSLANLDQDLPNYAQHQIKIHSLPQEWLWCESWCGNATKEKAKTIDLCNNPKTKEPKLQAARRIIAEWPALDEEQAAFTASMDQRYEKEQQAAAEAAEAQLAQLADSSSGGGGGSGGGGSGGGHQQQQRAEGGGPAPAGAGVSDYVSDHSEL